MNFKQANTSNFSRGRTSSIKYIVIHYTANKGDTAKNNADYFANNTNLSASAHYFVDENEVWQSVRDSDTAWHCGGGLQGSKGATFYGICRNSNSLGVEMCNFLTVNEKVVQNTVELVRFLMEQYNVPISNVIRHYDVTGKVCPAPFVNDEQQWENFKNQITKSEDEDDMPKMIYNYVDNNMPEWARPTIQKLVDKGYLKGNENGELGLDDTMLKIFVVHDRAGMYD